MTNSSWTTKIFRTTAVRRVNKKYSLCPFPLTVVLLSVWNREYTHRSPCLHSDWDFMFLNIHKEEGRRFSAWDVLPNEHHVQEEERQKNNCLFFTGPACLNVIHKLKAKWQRSSQRASRTIWKKNAVLACMHVWHFVMELLVGVQTIDLKMFVVIVIFLECLNHLWRWSRNQSKRSKRSRNN